MGASGYRRAGYAPIAAASGGGTATAPTVPADAAAFFDALTITAPALTSAATVDLSLAGCPGHYAVINGATGPITSFGTAPAGTERILRFASTPTITHNAASLILPGAVNIVAAAGDVMFLHSLGSGNWRCTSYTRGASMPALVTDLASTAAGKGLSLLGLQDAGGLIVATQGEAAFAELATNIAANVVSIAANATAIGLRPLTTDLASTAHLKGASTIGVEAGATNVEAAIAAAVSSIATLRTDLDIFRAKQGYLAETFPRALAPSPAGLPVSGTIYWSAIPLRAGDVVGILGTIISLAGAGVSVSKLGLFHPTTGALLAVTADQGTSWQSTGIKDIAVVTPYTVPTTDFYYAAFLVVASTSPGVARSGIATANALLAAGINGGRSPFFSQTGQTVFSDPATFGPGTGPGVIWMYAR